MKGLIKLLSSNHKALAGLIIITLFILAAIFAPLITKHVPNKKTGNPHEYPAFIVKAAQNNPDGWVAENFADSPPHLADVKESRSRTGHNPYGT